MDAETDASKAQLVEIGAKARGFEFSGGNKPIRRVGEKTIATGINFNLFFVNGWKLYEWLWVLFGVFFFLGGEAGIEKVEWMNALGCHVDVLDSFFKGIKQEPLAVTP